MNGLRLKQKYPHHYKDKQGKENQVQKDVVVRSGAEHLDSVHGFTQDTADTVPATVHIAKHATLPPQLCANVDGHVLEVVDLASEFFLEACVFRFDHCVHARGTRNCSWASITKSCYFHCFIAAAKTAIPTVSWEQGNR